MVADVARARKRVRIFLSHIEVPQLTLGPTVRRRCEPAHIGGCKFLRSTAQIGKEACQARATKSSDNPTYLVGRERFCEGLRAGRCRRWVTGLNRSRGRALRRAAAQIILSGVVVLIKDGKARIGIFG